MLNNACLNNYYYYILLMKKKLFHVNIPYKKLVTVYKQLNLH